jgi:hypothetical protein
MQIQYLFALTAVLRQAGATTESTHENCSEHAFRVAHNGVGVVTQEKQILNTIIVTVYNSVRSVCMRT